MKYIDIEISDGTTRSVPIYTVDTFPYNIYKYNHKTVRTKKGRSYVNLSASFDIETTSYTKNDKTEGFMYIWQFCLKDLVVMGRTWEEFQRFLDKLAEQMHLAKNKKIAVYVHYLPFEFQFMRNFLNVGKVFAKNRNDVLRCETECFEFRCSYALSNMGLSQFCKKSKLCTFYKRDGDNFDYYIKRTPTTPLTDDELAYCYCDVRGLCECIDTLLLDDTIASLPMTSTGYVRRECRIAVKENPNNFRIMQKTKLTPRLYALCKTASRGGNTHCNAIYSQMKLKNLKSYDLKSSYPAVMVTEKFPISPFVEVGKKERFRDYINEKACLIDVTFHNIRIKRADIIPYIPKAKCTQIAGARIDNGRVIMADSVSMVITDIDFKIIERTYNFDNIEYRSLHIAEYGYLNNEFRKLLMSYFVQKCALENGDAYEYAKFKNRINAFFGMMLTDICRSRWEYEDGQIDCWSEEPPDVQTALDKYYNNRNSFLSYQHGLWVTAHARNRLQKALDVVAGDVVYIDTDSVKYLGDHDRDFAKLNIEIIDQAKNNDIPAYVVKENGVITYLGVWELDAEYDEFISLGAKKYAYKKKGHTDVEITVAGLAKKSGAKFLNNNGGLDAFKIGTIVPAGVSGRTSANYENYESPFILHYKGEDILTASNVGIKNATYTFGVSDEYADYIEEVQLLELGLDNQKQ